ncbi:MAG: septum site-determining protein MinC [Lachnospiraceae bacterium]|nr:septum site-determining protein MinC [Lachnospiraceae bacterium]
MDNPVIIKGNNHGITVILDPAIEYAKLREYVADKFRDSSKFLGAAPVVLGFEGRALLPEQEKELLGIITESCELRIVCLVDNDAERRQQHERTLNEKLLDLSGASGTFYKGNLRSGQALTFETSVIILGDIHPGASVTSTGNIVVLGSLQGQAFAGAGGNEKAFVFAIDMAPVMIRIADYLARSADSGRPAENSRFFGKQEKEDPKKAEESRKMQIAFLEDGQICLEPLNKRVWNDIRL